MLTKLNYFLPLIALTMLVGACRGIADNTGGKSDSKELAEWKTWAPTPPMGWNSYDAFFGCVNEPQFREIVDILAEKYLPLGYEYAVMDFCWFNPGPEGYDAINDWHTFDINQKWDEDGSYSPSLTMDEYGRFLPSPNRFPSAANGKGFKELVDYTHSKGMKFGLHIIRGIPRQAVAENLPILGTDKLAGDVIHYTDESWTNNCHDVDITKEGAQEYYNSLFYLYAEWGVDYVKADHMMFPYYHEGEIQMIRNAIDQCGRPMLLSLSWGNAPLSYAHHLDSTANLWRISKDFWDRWYQVEIMFDLCANWVPFMGDGTWPDADMIPIGHLCIGGYPGNLKQLHYSDHYSFDNLSDDEHMSLMSLWCMARSPLMWGGDPLSTPEEYEKYLLNKELLEINQNSSCNREIFNKNNTRVWIACVPDSEDKYIALFNLGDEEQEVNFEFYWVKLKGSYMAHNIWTGQDEGDVSEILTRSIPSHGCRVYRLVRE